MAPKKQTLTRSDVLSSVRVTRSSTRRANGTGPVAVAHLPKKNPVKKTAKAKGNHPRQSEENSDDAPASEMSSKAKKAKSKADIVVKPDEEAESATEGSGDEADEDVSEISEPKKHPVKKKGKNVKSTPEADEKSDEEAESEKEKSGDVDEDLSEAPKVEEQSDEEAGSESKKIVIEHCTQCSSFKTRANQVKNGLESGVSGITILLNPDKPRRGCFEIREESGEAFISLLSMKRPFTKMKALNMDTVIEEIIAKIK